MSKLKRICSIQVSAGMFHNSMLKNKFIKEYAFLIELISYFKRQLAIKLNLHTAQNWVIHFYRNHICLQLSQIIDTIRLMHLGGFLFLGCYGLALFLTGFYPLLCTTYSFRRHRMLLTRICPELAG